MAKVRNILRIGILGPGAIGGFLAGLFWREGHDVLCVGRNEEVLAIEKGGIHIESPIFGNFVAFPKASLKLDDTVDVLFITIKSPFLNNALESLDAIHVESAVVVPLLNGLGHSDVIRAQVGPRVAVGMIGLIEVTKGEDGIIRQLSRQNPHIDLASDSDIAEISLEKVAEAIRTAGITTSILRTEAEVIWKKLVRLSAIASLTAAYQKTVGAIRSEPQLRRLLEEIVREGALVALHEGVDINPDEIINQIDSLPETLTTSLQRDVKAHTPSEVESITGGILRLAESCGIQVPTHEHAYRLIKTLSSVC
jgi:2-dehydropantoate 2-reductase